MSLAAMDESRLDADSTLPSLIRLGTSTWAFPEWRGVFYHRPYRNEKEFKSECLAEYVECPWFRTVCIDSLFYAPPKRDVLAKYASIVPPGFRWIAKVWERVTIPVYPGHPRYGADAGKPNPDFFNLDLFLEQVAAPFLEEPVLEHTAHLLFQFARLDPRVIGAAEFIERLGGFLRRLPSELRYAVEIRNGEFLIAPYVEALNHAGVAHCFNQWENMLTPRSQMERAAALGGLTAPFVTGRFLTPHGVGYREAGLMLEPYTSLKRTDSTSRDAALLLARRAIRRSVPAYITANNKVEGNAALFMIEVGKQLAKELCGEATDSA